MKKWNQNISVTEIATSGLFVVLLVVINHLIASSTIDHYCNPGIAFGIRLPQVVFTVMWVMTMAIVSYLYITTKKQEKTALKRIGLLMIIVGGLANIIDRAIHGCVIDYIALVPWNSFNIADTSIFIGAMLVLWHQWRDPQEEDTSAKKREI